MGDGIFLMIDGAGVDGADGAGVVDFNTVGGIRCVGVDDPNATTVDFVCKTRLIRVELVNAKTSTENFSLLLIECKEPTRTWSK